MHTVTINICIDLYAFLDPMVLFFLVRSPEEKMVFTPEAGHSLLLILDTDLEGFY